MKYTKGFALLISIVVTSLLLLISFVIVNVAFKQLVLSNDGQESQYAFYNAESGIECALYWDIKNGSASRFDPSASPTNISCYGQSVGPVGGSAVSNFTVTLPKGCVSVKVTKTGGDTTIDSRGYNTCAAGALRKFERGITTTY